MASQPKLRKYQHLPVIIEEDHHEVVPHIHRAIASRHLPMSKIAMVHFDSHPDLLLPLHMQADSVFDKEKLYNYLSIENWILPLVYAGHIDEIFWLKPPWADQLQEISDLKFGVGKHKETGEIRLTLSDPYFLTEALYAPESKLVNAKEVTLHVVTVTLENWNQPDGARAERTDVSAMFGQQARKPCFSAEKNKREEADFDVDGQVELPPHVDGVTVHTLKRACDDGIKETNEDNMKEEKAERNGSGQNDAPSAPKSKRADETHDGGNSRMFGKNDDANIVSGIKKSDEDVVQSGTRVKLISVDGGDQQSHAAGLAEKEAAGCASSIYHQMARKLQGLPFILDIDLDFFSTKDPFRNEHSPDVKPLLKELFCFSLPLETSQQNILEFSEQRQAQLDELEAAFRQLNAQQDSSPKLSDLKKQEALDKLVALLKAKSLQAGKQVDFEAMFRAGCTFDGTELPHHVSSPQQIEQLMTMTTRILQHLPAPTVISVARSSVDDYCPQDQVDCIQGAMLSVLKEVYHDVDVQMHYLHNQELN